MGARGRYILPSTSSSVTSSTPMTSHVLDPRTTLMTSNALDPKTTMMTSHALDPKTTLMTSHVLDPKTTLEACFFGKDGNSSLNFQEFSDFLTGAYFLTKLHFGAFFLKFKFQCYFHMVNP